LEDRRRDGGTNSTLRTKEQGKHLTLNEHDDDNDEYCILENPCARRMRLANRVVVTLAVRNTNVAELPGCTELCRVKRQLC